MKREARVLASRCVDSVCAGYVIRYPGVDGFSVGVGGCDALCAKLEEQGYIYEIRFYMGDCSCGLPSLTGKHSNSRRVVEIVSAYLSLAESIAKELAEAFNLCAGTEDSG